MKYLKTKHERNSAKITGLTVLIIALLLFVVGAPYKEIPDEYGVAINFGEPSVVNNKVASDVPSKAEEIIDDTQEEVTDSDETIEETLEEEVTEEEIKQEEAEIEALEKALEEQKAEAAAKEAAAIEEAAREEAAKQEAAEKLLAQQEEEALKIKEAKEAAEKIEAEKKAKEKIEAEKLAAAKVKDEQEAKAKADRIAKAKAEKEAREKAAREAKAEKERVAKAKADREAKAKAEKAAAERAAQAKADADRKAAGAAAAAEKNKNGGSTSGFKLSQEGAIYPGCEGKDNEERKKCMSNEVAKFVDAKFDKTIASDLGFTGDQKITIYFKINKNGQIFDIRARAADPKLIAEAVRVTKMLPKLKPALQQGKPIVVPFSASIRFTEQ